MDDKLLYNSNYDKQNDPFFTLNHWRKSLDTAGLYNTTHSRFNIGPQSFKTLGTSMNFSPMSPPSLTFTTMQRNIK